MAYISPLTKYQLWRKSGGRCEYEDCNEPLWKSGVTQEEFNTSNIAHIYGEKPTSARYEEEESPKLTDSFDNLMLLCRECHHLVDHGAKDRHTPEVLFGMKKKHEDRIELLTGLLPEKESHVLFYGANIGTLSSPLVSKQAFQAMLPRQYPASSKPIELGLKNSAQYDDESQFWSSERDQLRRQFNSKIKNRLGGDDIKHLSIFALAPQPLLMELGRLLSDLHAMEVFQLHREPPSSWIWQPSPPNFQFIVIPPKDKFEIVAINFSLSATINNQRINKVLGRDVSIWTVTIPTPNSDFIRGEREVSLFRSEMRELFDKIKHTHGQDTKLHVFPAMPISLAVEFGRVWMPKADMDLKIYDQNKKRDGFELALSFE